MTDGQRQTRSAIYPTVVPVPHNAHMSVAQLLMHAEAEGEPRFEVREAYGELPSEAREDELEAPGFGSQDLLWIAQIAAGLNFEVEEFEFRNTTFDPLEPDAEDAASRVLLDAFVSGGASGALELLNGELNSYVLVGVGLTSQDDDPIVIRRSGILDTARLDLALSLISDAWKVIHFS